MNGKASVKADRIFNLLEEWKIGFYRSNGDQTKEGRSMKESRESCGGAVYTSLAELRSHQLKSLKDK